jgi:hypothetical protein
MTKAERVDGHPIFSAESLGIHEDRVGQTVIFATTVEGKTKNLQHPTDNRGIWLTTPRKMSVIGYKNNHTVDFVIGPDGLITPVGILWNGNRPQAVIFDGVSCNIIEKQELNPPELDYIQLEGVPTKGTAQTVALRYPIQIREINTVLRLPDDINPFVFFGEGEDVRQFISGSKNRGFLTGLWTRNVTGLNLTRTGIPFDQSPQYHAISNQMVQVKG